MSLFFTKFQLDLSTFTSSDLTFISFKLQTLFFPYELSYYATGGPIKEKFRNLVKRSLYLRQNIIICVPMVVARISKNKIIFVLLNHVFFVLINQFKGKNRCISKQRNWFGFDNSFSLTKCRIRASCQQFGLFMAWIRLKIPFSIALERHEVFVPKIR